MGIIYKIISPSNKIYVGKTYDLPKRIAAYKCAVKYNKNILLHNSIRKYGWDAHILSVLEECEDEKMNEREMWWIENLKTYCYENKDGLNMTKGGDGQRSTWMHKKELRKYFSKLFAGEKNPFYGKKHSEETRQKLSQIAIARNKKNGTKVPKWGVEKGRLKVIKPVLQYDLQGNFIREFESIINVEKKLGINHVGVNSCCNNRQTQCHGFIFKYKTDNFPLKIEVKKIFKSNVKRPVIYLKGKNRIEYASALEASKELGIPKTTINRAAFYNNLKPIRSGHVFIYKDLYEGILKAAS